MAVFDASVKSLASLGDAASIVLRIILNMYIVPEKFKSSAGEEGNLGL